MVYPTTIWNQISTLNQFSSLPNNFILLKSFLRCSNLFFIKVRLKLFWLDAEFKRFNITECILVATLTRFRLCFFRFRYGIFRYRFDLHRFSFGNLFLLSLIEILHNTGFGFGRFFEQRRLSSYEFRLLFFRISNIKLELLNIILWLLRLLDEVVDVVGDILVLVLGHHHNIVILFVQLGNQPLILWFFGF